MPLDRFLIAPFNTGLQTDIRPWQIMDDAFALLKNAYIFRGRVRKRIGSIFTGNPPIQLNSRLRVAIGTTDVSGNLAFTSLPGNILNIGAAFSAGTIQFTVTTVPVVVGNALTLSTDQGPGGPAVGTVRLDSTGPNIYQFQISGGQTAIASTTVYWYPALPVMGLTQYQVGAINNHPAYAFDTQFAYVFNNISWNRSGSGTTPLWHDPSGNQSNYFWTYNYRAGTDSVITLFVSNFQVTNLNGAGVATDDPIWYLINDSSPSGTDVWTPLSGTNAFYFAPNGGAVHTGPYVVTARIIISFHGRLILLNTIENDNSGGAGVNSNFINRARFSALQDPFAVNSWYEENQTDAAGNFSVGAGFEDASVDEKIVGAQFIKDHLIVYFERSTWELVYTYNEARPFLWRRINVELGSQSTFSTVPFDTEVLAIGNTGVHACNGANTARIDQRIPDNIFTFKSTQTERTAGIRDYYPENVYWTYVSDLEEPTQKWPNQILLFNYRNRSWALFDDCLTTFGYYEQQQDTTWATSIPLTWQEFPGTWVDGIIQSNLRQIIAGTPEGFVIRLARDITRNAPSMQITNITFAATGFLTLTIIAHNLSATPSSFPNDSDFILLENIVADPATELLLNGSIVPVYKIIDANTILIDTAGALTSGTYDGGGTIARVSNIQIKTKQFNPYANKERNVTIQRADFGVSVTELGEITVDNLPSSSNVSTLEAGINNNALMGNNILETHPYDPLLYPLEQYQDLLWHPIYFQSSGTFIQLVLYFTPLQMANPNISLSDFELQGIALYTEPTSARLQ